MPSLPSSLTLPGPLIVVLIIGGAVLVFAAPLVSLLLRGSAFRGRGDGSEWSRALNGARERQHQQAAQMDALHRAVTDLAANKPTTDKPHE